MIPSDLFPLTNNLSYPGTGLSKKDITAPVSAIGNGERSAKAPEEPSGYYRMYIKKGALYSGGNGTGLSFYLEYAEGSTKENPLITAKGVDEKGNEFEQTISVNDVDPHHATIVELQSLASHYGVGEKIMGLSSLPAEIRNVGRTERVDLFQAFNKGIKDFKTVGRHDLEALYRKNYDTYLELFDQIRIAYDKER